MATPAPIQTPNNPSELQLFRVLQRANLLQYFDTFISQGGDDVQQLCEAGEDEFLEIMALVGMASKPLHVRRLQKALQSWVVNPAAFEGNGKTFPTHVHSMTGSSQNVGHSPSQSLSPSHSSSAGAGDRPIPAVGGVQQLQQQQHQQQQQDFKMTPPQSSTISTSTPWSTALSVNQGGATSPSDQHGSSREQPSPTDSQDEDFKDLIFPSDSNLPYSGGVGGGGGLSSLGQPILLEHQITAIATAAAILVQELPPIEPKSLPKKQISREINLVMSMSSEDPLKMEAMRKYAAIYGRFDSKRKNDRPMSLHEISVNEAAAQLCSHLPALLTRREELFPLARQVVRDSGYQYSKGHSRAAEIVTTKTEPTGDLSPESTFTSSSPPPPPLPATALSSRVSGAGDDKLTKAQNDLMDVTSNLSELVKEQERIRSALRVLLEAKDHTQMSVLTAEMDTINDRYARMTTRRQELVLQLAVMSRQSPKLSLSGTPFYSNNTGDINNTSPALSPESLKANPQKSILNCNNGLTVKHQNNGHNNNNNGLDIDCDKITPSANSLNSLYMAAALQNGGNTDGSLIEEGLRIATQYGMSDFAQELLGMKSLQQSPSHSSTHNNSNTNNNNNKSNIDTNNTTATTTTNLDLSTTSGSSSSSSCNGNTYQLSSGSLDLSTTTAAGGKSRLPTTVKENDDQEQENLLPLSNIHKLHPITGTTAASAAAAGVVVAMSESHYKNAKNFNYNGINSNKKHITKSAIIGGMETPSLNNSSSSSYSPSPRQSTFSNAHSNSNNKSLSSSSSFSSPPSSSLSSSSTTMIMTTPSGVNIVSGIGFQQYVSSPTTTTQRLPSLDTMKIATTSRTISNNNYNSNNSNNGNNLNNISNNYYNNETHIRELNGHKKDKKLKSPHISVSPDFPATPTSRRGGSTSPLSSSSSTELDLSTSSNTKNSININSNINTNHSINGNCNSINNISNGVISKASPSIKCNLITSDSPSNKVTDFITLSIPATTVNSDDSGGNNHLNSSSIISNTTNTLTATTTINADNLTMKIKLNNVNTNGSNNFDDNSITYNESNKTNNNNDSDNKDNTDADNNSDINNCDSVNAANMIISSSSSSIVIPCSLSSSLSSSLSPSPSESTRRSSRKRTSEPDYYLINGGEKRFRSHASRRSGSTSSEKNM